MKIDVEQFGHRAIQDALTFATAETWRRRAAQFETARPKQGDFFGAASSDQVKAQDRRLAAQAQACRNHAQVAQYEDFEDVLADVLAESADAESRAA